MPRPLDVTEKVFGRLTAKACVGSNGDGRIWLCQCECGAEARVLLERLTAGITRSCGCLRSDTAKRTVETTRASILTHGLSKSREMGVWNGMLRRCSSPQHRNFKHYGGRGISVCARWRNGEASKSGFSCFIEDMGRCPPGLTLDRIDNDGNYEPGNCRWATQTEQLNNMRRNRPITMDGETLNIGQWCKRLGVSVSTVRWRLRQGASPEVALRARVTP